VKKFYYLPLYLGILSLALSIPLVVLRITTKTPDQKIITRAKEELVFISVFPQKAAYKLNAEIPIGIILESGPQKIQRADAVLVFDPEMAEVLSVSPGLLMDEYPVLKFDNRIGQITIFAENKEARAVNGILASLKFRAKKPGVVAFTFAPQSTASVVKGGEFVITR
jgi:hypothetical protein